MKVVFIGAGNLATQLSLAMKSCGLTILQVYSHTETHARELAEKLSCAWTTLPEAIMPEADLYVFALKDAVLQEMIARIAPNKGLWVHTAGSMPVSVFEGYVARYGVFYPLQTFTKNRMVDFKRIPLFVEAKLASDVSLLERIASKLSDDVYVLSSERRKHLHLAAVFACNFTNHIYALAGKLLKENGIPEEVLLPLIDETAAKVHAMTPLRAQTGPAVRYDENVIREHLAMLGDPTLRNIYQLISRSIHKESQHE